MFTFRKKLSLQDEAKNLARQWVLKRGGYLSSEKPVSEYFIDFWAEQTQYLAGSEEYIVIQEMVHRRLLG